MWVARRTWCPLAPSLRHRYSLTINAPTQPEIRNQINFKNIKNDHVCYKDRHKVQITPLASEFNLIVTDRMSSLASAVRISRVVSFFFLFCQSILNVTMKTGSGWVRALVKCQVVPRARFARSTEPRSHVPYQPSVP